MLPVCAVLLPRANGRIYACKCFVENDPLRCTCVRVASEICTSRDYLSPYGYLSTAALNQGCRGLQLLSRIWQGRSWLP
eukprot:COSAG02_NODE_20245_length_841_cov_1.268194_1_plen_78_part_10